MQLQPKLFFTPQNVAFVAKQLLAKSAQTSLTLFPYRLVIATDSDDLMISTLDGRGIILVQKGEQIESNLKPSDWAWFDRQQKQLDERQPTIDPTKEWYQGNKSKGISEISSQRQSASPKHQGVSMNRLITYNRLIEDL